MQINVTDKNNIVHTVVCTPEMSINGRLITSMEEAAEEIDRVLSIRNDLPSTQPHFCPLFFRTEKNMMAFDARLVSSYEIIPELQE